MLADKDKTKDWKLLEAGRAYNNRLEPNYYETVRANLDFFAGNQWRNLKDSEMPKPVFNFIKRVITFFVASLTVTKAKIHFEPEMYMAPQDEEQEPLTGAEPAPPPQDRSDDLIAAYVAGKQVDVLFEKYKMEYRLKEALFDSAITGDAAAHFWWDTKKKPFGKVRPEIKGEIDFELVDGVNIIFGNPNVREVEKQPFIGVIGRDMVSNLKAEAKRNKNTAEADAVKADSNWNYQAGDNAKIEMEGDESGKAEYFIVYRKVEKTRKVTDQLTGVETDEEYCTIMASKCTETAYIFQDVDTGLERYPIAWKNWEKQKNTYRGRALCTGMLPNQIFINRMFAMVMYHLMMSAFPKAVYNADAIDVWTNVVGEAIPVTGVDLNTDLRHVAAYLQPGDMSAQIVQVIELVMQYTKEMLGATDSALGEIDPKNTSAIIAVQKSSAIPLENPKSNLYEFIEACGDICFDMMGTYYGTRPVMLEDGAIADYDFSQLKDAWLNMRVDVGESSYWSEIASSQTLDNLLAAGQLDIIEYLERQPDDMIPQKQELIASIKKRMAAQQAAADAQAQAQAQQNQPPAQGQEQAAKQAQAEQQAAMQAQQAQQQAVTQAQQAEQKHGHALHLKSLDIAGKLALAKAAKHATGGKK
jgi:hypothetical protein